MCVVSLAKVDCGSSAVAYPKDSANYSSEVHEKNGQTFLGSRALEHTVSPLHASAKTKVWAIIGVLNDDCKVSSKCTNVYNRTQPL